MKNKEKLDEIAEGIADVTIELMDDSVDWQLEDVTHEEEEYDAIHSYVVKKAIELLYFQTRDTFNKD
jgi:hypothetical protein